MEKIKQDAAAGENQQSEFLGFLDGEVFVPPKKRFSRTFSALLKVPTVRCGFGGCWWYRRCSMTWLGTASTFHVEIAWGSMQKVMFLGWSVGQGWTRACKRPCFAAAFAGPKQNELTRNFQDLQCIAYWVNYVIVLPFVQPSCLCCYPLPITLALCWWSSTTRMSWIYRQSAWFACHFLLCSFQNLTLASHVVSFARFIILGKSLWNA